MLYVFALIAVFAIALVAPKAVHEFKVYRFCKETGIDPKTIRILRKRSQP